MELGFVFYKALIVTFLVTNSLHLLLHSYFIYSTQSILRYFYKNPTLPDTNAILVSEPF